MHTGTPRRAKNSLSLKKFTDRLNKGLPIFVAYAMTRPHIVRYDECRDLHFYTWRYPSGSSNGAEFIHVTKHYRTWTYDDTTVALTDMNVMRNKYNKNFVFRTEWAAEQWLLDMGVIRFPGPVARPGFFKKVVDKIIIRAKI